ncbi:MAG: Flp pilus assembly complex ATPase component TadA [Verrucomicrobiales bacterium]|nr:Flp pilus assembly complex ATPase component TadA [Verrucomicrobiales bacterium]
MEHPHRIDQLCCDASRSASTTDLYLCENSPPHLRSQNLVSAIDDTLLSRQDLADFWTHCGADPQITTDHDSAYVASNGRRFRVNLNRQLGKLAAVLRPIEIAIPSFEQLQLASSVLADWSSRSSGLVLLTGPTGCGKSTSVAACLEWINQQRQAHIVTIEDPIEFLFQSKNSIFTQREVGSDTPSFQQGLRRALRQSPHVIFVGEIRDQETAVTALQAAETGHLVFSTLHCHNISDAVERLSNLFPVESRDSALLILSKQLVGIMAQRLLPGSEGRLTPVSEYIQNLGATPQWIREGAHQKIADLLSREGEGNQSFLQSILTEFRAGNIDENTAIQACDNPDDFDRAQRGISTRVN